MTFRHSIDRTEYEDMTPPSGTDLFEIEADMRDYMAAQYVEMVTAESPDKVKEVIQNTIDEAYKKGFAKLEEYKQAKLEENLKILNKE